jgi:alkylation response protein AidB-like acyl-CoA dehydrogenase
MSDSAPTGAFLVPQMSQAELARAQRVNQIIPSLASAAEAADRAGRFHLDHKRLFREQGLLGLVVPKAYGGLGGTLRDLAAATFAMGTACPSTALAYFFHCSSVSRGLLALEAAEKGADFDPEARARIHEFGEMILNKMGTEGQYLGNFASESAKSANSSVFISTEATATDQGWRLNGVKAFGCNTGVADAYLITAKLAGYETANGIGLFLVPSDTPGIRERPQWDALGMRATASHGVILEDVEVPTEAALTIPGAFVSMMNMSRGSLLGNQLAISAIYFGAAKQSFDFAMKFTTDTKFRDTGASIATSPFHQELIGKILADLETARLWLQKQLELETAEPPLVPKSDVVRQWRVAKGEISEASFRVAQNTLKMCGTSNTGSSSVISRMLRDIAMSLVMAFPAERGRLEAAKSLVEGQESVTFTV